MTTCNSTVPKRSEKEELLNKSCRGKVNQSFVVNKCFISGLTKETMGGILAEGFLTYSQLLLLSFRLLFCSQLYFQSKTPSWSERKKKRDIKLIYLTRLTKLSYQKEKISVVS